MWAAPNDPNKASKGCQENSQKIINVFSGFETPHFKISPFLLTGKIESNLIKWAPNDLAMLLRDLGKIPKIEIFMFHTWDIEFQDFTISALKNILIEFGQTGS